MLEGYKRKGSKKRRGYGKARKSPRRRHLGETAQQEKFGRVAKVCLTGPFSRKKKGECMKIGLRKGIEAAKSFKARM